MSSRPSTKAGKEGAGGPAARAPTHSTSAPKRKRAVGASVALRAAEKPRSGAARDDSDLAAAAASVPSTSRGPRADAKAGAAAGKKKAAVGKGKAAEAGKEVEISRKKRAVAMKKQDKGKESGGDLAPARQPLPPGDGRSVDGHYWLDRPEAKLLKLPRHKKDFTPEQLKLGAKSCHICMKQHVALPCKSKNDSCDISFCHGCCKSLKHISEVCMDEEWQRYAAGWCPRCLGFCTCRACMRKLHPREDYSAPKHQEREYARHVLRYVAPLLAGQHALKLAEVAAGAEPVAYGDVRWEDPEDFRHMCDRCCTSISDLHRTCAECASTEKGDGFELCLHCCAEAREAGQAQVCCEEGHTMELVRFFNDAMAAALQQTIEMGDGGDMSFWEWRQGSTGREPLRMGRPEEQLTGNGREAGPSAGAAPARSRDGQCRARRRAGEDAAGGSGSAAAAAEPSPDSQPAAAAEDPAAAAGDANGGRRSAGEDEPGGSGSGAAAAERNPDGWIDDGDEELPVDLVEEALAAVEAHKALTRPDALPLVSNESLSGYVALRVSGAKKPARMIADFYESDPEAEPEAEPRVTEFYPRAPGLRQQIAAAPKGSASASGAGVLQAAAGSQGLAVGPAAPTAAVPPEGTGAAGASGSCPAAAGPDSRTAARESRARKRQALVLAAAAQDRSDSQAAAGDQGTAEESAAPEAAPPPREHAGAEDDEPGASADAAVASGPEPQRAAQQDTAAVADAAATVRVTGPVTAAALAIPHGQGSGSGAYLLSAAMQDAQLILERLVASSCSEGPSRAAPPQAAVATGGPAAVPEPEEGHPRKRARTLTSEVSAAHAQPSGSTAAQRDSLAQSYLQTFIKNFPKHDRDVAMYMAILQGVWSAMERAQLAPTRPQQAAPPAPVPPVTAAGQPARENAGLAPAAQPSSVPPAPTAQGGDRGVPGSSAAAPASAAAADERAGAAGGALMNDDVLPEAAPEAAADPGPSVGAAQPVAKFPGPAAQRRSRAAARSLRPPAPVREAAVAAEEASDGAGGDVDAAAVPAGPASQPAADVPAPAQQRDGEDPGSASLAPDVQPDAAVQDAAAAAERACEAPGWAARAPEVAASIAPLPAGQRSWHQVVPDESKRLAASRPDGQQNYVYTPTADDLAMWNPNRPAQVRLFQEVWREGVPVVVRAVRKGYAWDPDTMSRATNEKNKAHGATKDEELDVLKCTDWSEERMTEGKYFKLYKEGRGDGDLYKLKDWPPNAHFSERLGRHNQDFLEMLPMPEYSHPKGPLNLVSYLEDNGVKPDLGPKSYVACGRVKEHAGEGDSVTKMHCDLSDAINVMCHQAGEGADSIVRCGNTLADMVSDPSYGGAGAVWDIWPRDSRKELEAFLRRHADEFAAEGVNVDVDTMLHPIHDQDFFLTARHRAMLKSEYGVESWHFEQHQDEAVFIPAGCPHQVRNLKSCIKVAIDFVSPESAEQCLELMQERRQLTLRENKDGEEKPEAPEDRRHCDKLQAELMIARAAAASLAALR